METSVVPEDAVLESPWDITTNILRNAMNALASLRLTVALLAMAVFIVLAGTLGQVERDIWDVINDYFRMNFTDDETFWASFSMFGRELIIPTPFTKIELSIFFPPSFWGRWRHPGSHGMVHSCPTADFALHGLWLGGGGLADSAARQAVSIGCVRGDRPDVYDSLGQDERVSGSPRAGPSGR